MQTPTVIELHALSPYVSDRKVGPMPGGKDKPVVLPPEPRR